MLSNFGHRVYAVTERNKWFGGALSSLIVIQFSIGIYMTVTSALAPCKSFGSSFACRQTHVIPSGAVAKYKPRPIQGLYYCVESASGIVFPKCWDRLRYVITVSPWEFLRPSYPTPSSSWVTAEVVAFAAIFFTARKPRHGRYPGIPSLLDAIWRDATEYFLLITLCDVLSDAFIIFAPVGGIPQI
jgi:hypothetical protein